MLHEDDQATLDPAVKKAVLRAFTYGLYAVGVADGDSRNMFTANWLTQVSFDPPLLALSVENNGHSIELLRRGGSFAVSVFTREQREETGILGKRWSLRPDKIEAVSYRLGSTGCPILQGAVGAIECQVTNSMDAGDSTVFLGRVVAAYLDGDGATPLTMSEAGFRHAG